MNADVIVVGAGLAGLVTAHELTRRGKTVVIVDQENGSNIGGQAYWSLGGLFLVKTPEQRRLGIRDSFELAWNDWQGSAAFDRCDDEDLWARQWARAYVEFATEEKRAYLLDHGISFVPGVGWAERGDLSASGHGNSVPRFHLSWGAGTGVVQPFADSALRAVAEGTLTFRHRHRVDELLLTDGAVTGVRGSVLSPDASPRGVASTRTAIAEFELTASAVVIASGGIGANHEMVRRFWPTRLGAPPKRMLTGVPAHVDGRMLDIATDVGARLVNRDRMWHYVEGVANWNPVWPNHAIRVLAGPSAMWFDALGKRLPAPCLPGYDTLGTLRYLRTTPRLGDQDHSWFIANQKILAKEFVLSGSEQNPDIASKDKIAVLRQRLLHRGPPAAVQAFVDHGADFVVADTVEDLVAQMNLLTEDELLDSREIRRQIQSRDLQVANPFSKDAQIQGIRNARRSFSDRIRIATPQRILDPAARPLIGIKLNILTRKTLGGLQTDLAARVLTADGRPLPGLHAVGEAAGFGGGGVHGYNALEGTFLGGCIFSGLRAGRSLAQAL